MVLGCVGSRGLGAGGRVREGKDMGRRRGTTILHNMLYKMLYIYICICICIYDMYTVCCALCNDHGGPGCSWRRGTGNREKGGGTMRVGAGVTERSHLRKMSAGFFSRVLPEGPSLASQSFRSRREASTAWRSGGNKNRHIRASKT